MNSQGLRVFFSVLAVLAALAIVWASATFLPLPLTLLLVLVTGTGISFIRKKWTAFYLNPDRRIPYQKKFVIFFHWYFILVVLLAFFNLVWPPKHLSFNTGFFWLVAATSLVGDWWQMLRKQGVYIGEKRIYLQESQLRTIDPSYVFYLEEDSERIRFRYRFSSTTLYRKDFATEDWSRLQKEIDDWSARNGIAEETHS